MEKEVKLLEVVDGETLMDMQFPKSRFCIQSLLPQGVSILGGAPKIGKSWMVLDWCVRIAKGEDVWNLPTEKGTVLYLCLENSLVRIQGRDIEQREFQLSFNKENCTWGLINDSLENPVPSMPQEMIDFIEFMESRKHFKGSNTDLVDSFNVIKGYSLSAKSLKQMMNKFKYELKESGVQFISHRSNGQRLVEVSYQAKSDSSAVSDETNDSVKTSVPFVPCEPVGEIWADERKIG